MLTLAEGIDMLHRYRMELARERREVTITGIAWELPDYSNEVHVALFNRRVAFLQNESRAAHLARQYLRFAQAIRGYREMIHCITWNEVTRLRDRYHPEPRYTDHKSWWLAKRMLQKMGVEPHLEMWSIWKRGVMWYTTQRYQRNPLPHVSIQ